MRIIDYKYIHGTEDRVSSVKQFIKLANLDITLDKPTAFLYVSGFSMCSSELGVNVTPRSTYTPVIKVGLPYVVHEWVYTFKNKEHLRKVDMMTGTCAAGIQALYEAERLINDGLVEEVIIIGGERITDDTIKLFKELRIPMLCGDGFFYMKLGKSDMEGNDPHIDDIKWKFNYHNNPFVFPKEVLDTLAPGYPVDYVKLHATGTEANAESESGLEALGKPIVYKSTIGHTQGISSLLETCMLLADSSISGKILVAANGFGGFYGAFTLLK